jgi:predicted DNA-binding transcriptional regulator AlpA
MEINELQLIAADPLCKLMGDVSTMTISRWMAERDFPQPIVASEQGRRFWRLKEVAAWQERNRRTPRSKPGPFPKNLAEAKARKAQASETLLNKGDAA